MPHPVAFAMQFEMTERWGRRCIDESPIASVGLWWCADPPAGTVPSLFPYQTCAAFWYTGTPESGSGDGVIEGPLEPWSPRWEGMNYTTRNGTGIWYTDPQIYMFTDESRTSTDYIVPPGQLCPGLAPARFETILPIELWSDCISKGTCNYDVDLWSKTQLSGWAPRPDDPEYKLWTHGSVGSRYDRFNSPWRFPDGNHIYFELLGSMSAYVVYYDPFLSDDDCYRCYSTPVYWSSPANDTERAAYLEQLRLRSPGASVSYTVQFNCSTDATSLTASVRVLASDYTFSISAEIANVKVSLGAYSTNSLEFPVVLNATFTRVIVLVSGPVDYTSLENNPGTLGPPATLMTRVNLLAPAGGSNGGSNGKGSSALDGGAIAGIVIGSLAGAALLAAIGVMLTKQKGASSSMDRGQVQLTSEITGASHL